jgi:16S rRNA (cytosine967-C5)-methyltransferase
MKTSVRYQAVEILNQISASQAFAGPLINDFLDKNALSGTPDGRLLTHLVYGTLRLRGHLDWILSKLCRGNFEKLDEGIKNVLRTGLYQLKFSDRLPDFAVVNEAVQIAKRIKPDKSSLVNAVLRNYLRRGQDLSFPSEKNNLNQYIATFHSHPLWLVKKWMKIFGPEETRALCSANNELPPLALRVNTLKISRGEIKQRLVVAGFTPEDTKFSPDGIVLSTSANPIQKTDFFEAGFLRIQDEGAQLISYLVNPKKNEALLDVCAGTGGKSTHLAAILKNEGRIVAVDRNPDKLAELKQEATRLGINIIETQTADLSAGLSDEFKEKFDCVLVDAPCSGTGTLRRNPEIKWRMTQKDLLNFVARQKIILQNSSSAVKKGGRLIYCTCSLLTEENEKVVEDFLKKNNNFSLGTLPTTISRPLADNHGFFHTYPHRNHIDGFFGAILKSK